MFGKKSDDQISIKQLSSLIADNLCVEGNIVFSDGLRVDGRIVGDVSSVADQEGLLILNENGRIKGNVRVYDAVINGTVIGDIEVEHFLELQPKACIQGRIRYRRLQMACGASVQGELLCLGTDESEAAEVRALPHLSPDAGDKPD